MTKILDNNEVEERTIKDEEDFDVRYRWTIASRQTKDGLAPGLTPEDILSYIPAVKNVCEVQTKQVCNLDSTNVTPEHWKMMVKAVEDNYAYYDGFVICHGTDTLAYTAAALSYMIQNSAKPIVVTGAQKPINMDVTDAKTNLLDSFIYAADDDSQGVNLVFDGKVIVGTRAKKSMQRVTMHFRVSIFRILQLFRMVSWSGIFRRSRAAMQLSFIMI